LYKFSAISFVRRADKQPECIFAATQS